MINNILPYLYIILICETLRYEIIRKGDGSSFSYVQITIIMILIDATIFLETYNLATYNGLVKYICYIILLSVFKNSLLLYLVKIGEIHPSFVYRVIMD